jgi:hypothetical protein
MVVFVALVAPSLAGEKRPQAKPPEATHRAIDNNAIIVDGYGPDIAAAKDRALEHAREQVEKMLLERFGSSGWRPTEEQIDATHLLNQRVVVEEGKPELGPKVDEEQVIVARYRVQLTAGYVKELLDRARQERVVDRHSLLARILVAAVALALVCSGYLRLEESTRGYATRLLRLAAVVILSLVGFGLWLTW